MISISIKDQIISFKNSSKFHNQNVYKYSNNKEIIKEILGAKDFKRLELIQKNAGKVKCERKLNHVDLVY